jgi:hypothetical protein
MWTKDSLEVNSIEMEDPIETGTPNRETSEACRELDEGRGLRFSSREEFFESLKN